MVFTGSDLQCFVTLGSGSVVVVRLANDQPGGERLPVAPGQKVWVRWEVGSTEVLGG